MLKLPWTVQLESDLLHNRPLSSPPPLFCHREDCDRQQRDTSTLRHRAKIEGLQIRKRAERIRWRRAFPTGTIYSLASVWLATASLFACFALRRTHPHVPQSSPILRQRHPAEPPCDRREPSIRRLPPPRIYTHAYSLGSGNNPRVPDTGMYSAFMSRAAGRDS